VFASRRRHTNISRDWSSDVCSSDLHLIIDSIKNIHFSLTQKLVEAKPFPLFVRGVKVNLSIDAQVFRGHSLYIFTQLLSHIFNRSEERRVGKECICDDEGTNK